MHAHYHHQCCFKTHYFRQRLTDFLSDLVRVLGQPVEHLDRLRHLLVDCLQVLHHLRSDGLGLGRVRLFEVLVPVDRVQSVLLDGLDVVFQRVQDARRLQMQRIIIF